MVKYSYDAWGNCEREVLDEEYATMAELNPFRYRSYYFDTETNLYYLQTRYYDPETGRFLSQDDVSYLDPEHINGLNLYAYCGNNPVMRTDNLGTDWWIDFWNGTVGNFVLIALSAVAMAALAAAFMGLAIVTGGLAGVALMSIGMGIAFGAAIGGASAAINGTNIAAGILCGGIKSGAVGTAVGLGIMTGGGAFSVGCGFLAFGGAVGINFAAGMVNYLVDNIVNGRTMNLGDAFASGGLQALSGAFAFIAGVIIGVSKLYNIPGTTKMFSAAWFGHILWGQYVKFLFYYPFSILFGYLQKKFFSGSN